MLDNETQEQVLKEAKYSFKTSKTGPRRAKSFNDLSLSLFCTGLTRVRERGIFHPDAYVEFTDIDKNLMSGNIATCGYTAYKCISSFIKNPELKMLDIAKMYQNKVAKLDLNEEVVKFSTEIYVQMMGFLSDLSDEWNTFHGIISNEMTYRTYGKINRDIYKTPIDLLALTYTGEIVLYVLTPRAYNLEDTYSDTTGSFLNIRILHLLNHFYEAGYKISKVKNVMIPIANVESIVIHEMDVNNIHLNIANSFYSNHYDLHPNPALCNSCQARRVCSTSRVITGRI